MRFTAPTVSNKRCIHVLESTCLWPMPLQDVTRSLQYRKKEGFDSSCGTGLADSWRLQKIKRIIWGHRHGWWDVYSQDVLCNFSSNNHRQAQICRLLYLKKMKTSLSTFNLNSLPPTSSAVKLHAYRVYFTVQEWLGNPGQLKPINFGWQICDGKLQPIFIGKETASHWILRMISCGCKTGCGKRCTCRKSGLTCTEMCSKCYGYDCTNTSPVDGSEGK